MKAKSVSNARPEAASDLTQAANAIRDPAQVVNACRK